MTKIIQRLDKVPEDIEEMNELRDFCHETLEVQLQKVKSNIDEIMEKMNLLQVLHYKISYEDFSRSWSIYGMPLELRQRRQETLSSLKILENRFSEDLLISQNILKDEIKNLSIELEGLQIEQDVDRTSEISYQYADVGEKLQRAKNDASVINRREAILKWKVTDYVSIEKIDKNFQPYNKVWEISNNYSLILIMLETSMNQIDRGQITSQILESWSELVKLEKGSFKTIPHMKMVCRTVRKVYEGFKPNLPVINDLRNPCLMKRHWTKINNIIKEFNEQASSED